LLNFIGKKDGIFELGAILFYIIQNDFSFIFQIYHVEFVTRQTNKTTHVNTKVPHFFCSYTYFSLIFQLVSLISLFFILQSKDKRKRKENRLAL
jgi:hypothetical protein